MSKAVAGAAAAQEKPQLILSIDTSSSVPSVTVPQSFNSATASRAAPGHRVQAGRSDAMTKDEQSFVDEFGFQLRDEAAIQDELRYVRGVDGEQVKRREVKWESMTKDWDRANEQQWDKIKSRCRKGIPTRLRGISWQMLVGSRAKLTEHAGVYRQLAAKVPREDVASVIERDLSRTFPTHALFRDDDGAGQQQLRNILYAYCAVDPEVEYCLAKDDMELMTDTGFVDYAEAKRRHRAGTLVVAGFDEKSRKIVYEKPSHFIDKPGAPDDGLYEITAASGDVSIRVTGQHKLLRWLKSTDSFCKTTVDDVRSNAGSKEDVFLVGYAENGVDVRDTLGQDVPLSDLIPALGAAANATAKEDLVRRFLRLFGCWLRDGALVAGPCGQRSVAFSAKTAADKQLVRESLELCGLERAGGDWRDDASAGCVAVTHAHWVEFFLGEFGGDINEPAKRIPGWAWRLGQKRAAALLLGFSDAAAADCTVHTSSADLRDQLVRFAMHAGFSASFTQQHDGVDSDGCWCVSFGARNPRICAPEIKKVVGYDEGTWCVRMPHGNIVVRRRDGDVGKSWRPLIIGNCQGEGFLVATLLTQMTEEEAFWCFHEMMQQNLFAMRELFRPNFPMLQLCFYQLKRLIGVHCPKVLTHLEEQGLDVSIFASQWFMTLFSYHFPFRAVLRLWDIFLCEGWKIIFRVAITLLKWEENNIVGQPIDVCMKTIRCISDNKNPDEIIERSLKIKFKTESLLEYRNEYETWLRQQQAEAAAAAASSASAIK